MDDTEELIHAGDKTPDTPQKRRQNWWHYNKQYLFGGLALLLVIGSLVYTIALRASPDYIVGLITSYSMPEAGRQQLEGLLAQYADDRNGDGHVVVQLNTYAFTPNSSDYAQREADMVKLPADLITNECMIFLHDEAALNEIASSFEGLFQYNDGTPMAEGARDFENAMTPWGDFAAFAAFEPDPDQLNMWDPQIFLELCQTLRVSVRAAQGTTIEQDEEAMAYHRANVGYLERLLTGEKPVFD